jgi:hypothetical protein
LYGLENLLSASIAAEKMTVLAKGVKGILSAFAAAKFISSFTVDEDDIADKIFAESSFVEVNLHSAQHVFLLILLSKTCLCDMTAVGTACELSADSGWSSKSPWIPRNSCC